MPLRNVATTFTIEQQRLEINNLAGDVNNIATGVTNVGTAATANALAAGATGADLTLSGTLTVNGTQTILNTETLQVEDKEIVIGNVSSPTDATAHGGGWKLKGANNKTITYNQTGDKWVSNKDFEVPQLIATQAATTEFIQAIATNNGTRSIASFEGKDSSGNAVTLKMGGYGDTQRGEIFTHSNHALGFATNNAATQMILDTSGSLGIGTNSVDRKLHVKSSGLIAKFESTSANALIMFATPTNEAANTIPNIGANDNDLEFTTGNISRLKITSVGDVTLGYAGNSLYFENGFNNSNARIQNTGSSNNSTLRFLTRNAGTEAEKLLIGTDKVMTSVDFKPDTHHQRDIGTASNGFRDIYGQTITVSTAYDSKGNVRSVPAKEPGNANYTLAATDAGKYVDSQGSGTTITVPANTFSQGDVVTILRATSGDCTIAQGSGVTMYHSADGANTTTGNRTLAQRGMATMIFVNANYCYISGAGLS